jgi:hypothetical protein
MTANPQAAHGEKCRVAISVLTRLENRCLPTAKTKAKTRPKRHQSKHQSIDPIAVRAALVGVVHMFHIITFSAFQR